MTMPLSMPNRPVSQEIDCAALIIAYKRVESLSEVLEACKRNSVKRIYISIDAPKDEKTALKQTELRAMIQRFRKGFQGEIKILQRKINVGCAASILSAIDWVFESEKYALIIEDDCIPSDEFFLFSRRSFPIIEKNSDIWLSCGTQLAPSGIDYPKDDWLLSKYALTWGWATTDIRWREAREGINRRNKILNNYVDNTYWSAGAERAIKGYTDVWDTLFLKTMLANQKLAILPRAALVRNVGNDENATHTIGDSPWLNISLGNFTAPNSDPKECVEVDVWLRDNIYQISLAHVITTKFTKLKDVLGLHKNLGDLMHRWARANYERQSIL